MKRTWVCSDLHGNRKIFNAMKEKIGAEDTVIFLGDAIDRGPDGWNILKEMLTDERFIVLKGNHEDLFVKELLPKIFRQVIISRSYRVFFTLKYDNGFFPDPMWEKVLRLFNYYHNSLSGIPQSQYLQALPNDTLFDFAAGSQKKPKWYYGEVLSKDEIREIFAFVRENNYELFKDFYECTALKLLGGTI